MLAAKEEGNNPSSTDKSSRLKESAPQPLLGLLQPLPALSTRIAAPTPSLPAVRLRAASAFYEQVFITELLDPPRA